MYNVMGMINNAQQDDFLGELTAHRSLAAVPFGSRYRLIDFTLSNMSNSGISNVGILLHAKYRALLDHLGPGKEWNLDRKRDGLFLLPPAQAFDTNRLYRGDLENFLCNTDYLEKSSQEYVLISGTNIVCNIDYQQVYDFHLESGADITVLYKDNQEGKSYPGAATVRVGKEQRITDIKMKFDGDRSPQIALGNYLLRKSLLLDIIHSCEARGAYNLIKDGFISNLDQLDIRGFPHQGYLAMISSLQDYFRSNMELLNPEVLDDLFLSSGTIHTKIKDEAPSRFTANSRTNNTLLANGCRIEGLVENSILFRGVEIRGQARVKNCIAMQKCVIEEGTEIENAIIGKEARITREKTLIGEQSHPLIVKKREVV